MTKIIEKRTKPYKIGPAETWIPDGASNTLHDVMSHGSNVKVGDIEIGTDGFVQMVIQVDKVFIKLFKHPSQDTASVLVTRR